MRSALIIRSWAAVITLTLLAGCVGASTYIAPNHISSNTSSLRSYASEVRVLRGPAVTGPIIVPLVPHPANLPHRWPKTKSGQLLFVADATDNQVLMYDPKESNPTPLGAITKGIDNPVGIAFDAHGKLYVVNLGNNTVTVYPRGANLPSATISKGIDSPYGIGIDSKRNVFVTNTSSTVVGYHPGKSSPFETIDFASEGQPTGLTVDANDNIWIACDNMDTIWEIPSGSSTPQNTHISRLGGPLGLSFGKNGMLYVSNYGNQNVTVYADGGTSPILTLTNGISHPTLSGFAASGRFFQSNSLVDTVGYRGFKKNETSPFATITGNPNPAGIAGYPLVKQ